MNYVLLSGGSGKRLWPLSNEVRSKQFIKILQKNENVQESMVQRVYHQILNINKDANITIATSHSQVPQLLNQLNKNVNISIEPCRKDTFPAIVLACLYLYESEKVDENEMVVICPVDPYVEDNFFTFVQELKHAVIEKNANIGLIGIEPTYPSEKYGYILPYTKDKISFVKKFIEKPNTKEAEEHIANGALWNGGVFCFKLKYLLDKAHELINFKDYNDLYNKYETVEKISFDYAVLEKEKNIIVSRYRGVWKDIGTWNTLTEVMSNKILGDAILDDKSENSHLINELNIPMIGMGLKNIVVAASPDGIFISDKNESSFNKKYVDKLDNRPMYEERKWGDFKILDMYKNSLVKHLTIKKGESLSYQLHHFRDEVWTIIEGNGVLKLDDAEKEIKAGDVLYIRKEQKHSIKAITDLHFIEVQIGEKLSEDDIERFNG